MSADLGGGLSKMVSRLIVLLLVLLPASLLFVRRYSSLIVPQAAVPGPAAGMPAPFSCTNLQLLEQSKFLRFDIMRLSSCPGQALWPLLIEAGGLSCKPIVVMDVGANKGYTIASLMDLLMPELGITPAALHPYLQSMLADAGQSEDVICGACHDCKEGHTESSVSRACTLPSGGSVPSSAFPVTFYGVEPQPSNVNALQMGIATLFEKQRQEVGLNASSLYILPVAMGAQEGNVDFTLCQAGSEGCGVAEEKQASSGVVRVPLKTVDGLAAELGLKRIDILLIDTEGLDPNVLAGASAMLGRQAVSILVFEYNSMRAWAVTSLKTVIGDLDVSELGLFLPSFRRRALHF